MNHIIVSLAACLLLVGCETATKPGESPGPVRAHVIKILDGRTFSVDIDGKVETVRLIGVDTGLPGSPEAIEAETFLTEYLRGKGVELVTDAEHGERDQDGRMLAYVYRESDGVFVNAEIVRAGFGATDMAYTCRYTSGFRMLERAARRQGTDWVATEAATPNSDSAGVMFAGRPEEPPVSGVRPAEPAPEPVTVAITPTPEPATDPEQPGGIGELFSEVGSSEVTTVGSEPDEGEADVPGEGGSAPVLLPVITEEAVVVPPGPVIKPIQITVYVTDGRTTYHTSDCPYLWKGKTAMPLDEARQSYTPCDRCNPPK